MRRLRPRRRRRWSVNCSRTMSSTRAPRCSCATRDSATRVSPRVPSGASGGTPSVANTTVHGLLVRMPLAPSTSSSGCGATTIARRSVGASSGACRSRHRIASARRRVRRSSTASDPMARIPTPNKSGVVHGRVGRVAERDRVGAGRYLHRDEARRHHLRLDRLAVDRCLPPAVVRRGEDDQRAAVHLHATRELSVVGDGRSRGAPTPRPSTTGHVAEIVGRPAGSPSNAIGRVTPCTGRLDAMYELVLAPMSARSAMIAGPIESATRR